MKISAQKLLVIIASLTFFYSQAYTKPGDLDSTFGENGILKDISDEYPNLELRGMVIQKDNKIVVAGRYRKNINSNYNILLKRYNVDGSIDSSFGNNGITKESTNDRTYGICSIINDIEDNSFLLIDPFTICKFKNNGFIDTNFADNGYKVFEGSASYCLKYDLPGKILYICGIANKNDTGMGLIRLNSNGSIDSTFNNKGYIAVDFDRIFGRAASLSKNDNKYFLCGSVFYNEGGRDYGITSTDLKGKIDSSFGKNGRFKYKYDEISIIEHSIINNNYLYIIGWSEDSHYGNHKMRLLRLTLNGKIDSSFGKNGNVDLKIADNDYPRGFHFQNDGKILISGESEYWGIKVIFLARYKPDGKLDSNFANNGIAMVRVGDYYNLGGYSSIISDDYAMLAGTFSDSSNTGLCLLKYKLSMEVGVIEELPDDSALIYPNPVKNYATINFELLHDGNITIELYYETGQLIKTFTKNSFWSKDRYEEKLDLSDIPTPGIYFIKIIQHKKTIIIKLIKE